MESYGQSKTANVLFSVGLTKRYAKEGIFSNALMPGGIMTNLQRHIPKEEQIKIQHERRVNEPNIWLRVFFLISFKVGTLPSVRRPETQASISKPLVAKLQNTLSQEHNVYSK